jgi:Tol biopolymer transport system component
MTDRGSFRILVVCATALILAGMGCGGDDEAIPDAGATIDASATHDGLTRDAPDEDASQGDGGGPVTSYLYYWGDFDVSSEYRVARIGFPDGGKTTLSLAEMPTGAEVESIAVSPDGTKLAVAGRKSAGNEPVLNVYNADGSGPATRVYTGGQNTDFLMLSYSPNGTMLAFLADIDLDNSMALYVVPANGSAAPKRVSLAPVSVDQFVVSYKWAADSAHIAFTGDLETDHVHGLWTVDALPASPVPIPIVTLAELTATDTNRDVDDVIAFDSSNRLYFRSDYEVANELHRLYRCDLDGSNRAQVPGTNLTNAGGGSEASTGPFAISSDGTTLAFFADSPSATLFQVYVMPLSGSTATRVSDITTTPGDGSGPDFFAPQPIVWSADGSRLAVIADWPVDGGDQADDFAAFVLPSSAPAGGVRVLEPTAADGDALEIEYTPDNTRLVIRGDVLEDGTFELFATADFTTADQDATAIRVEEVPDNGDVWGFETSL